MVDTDGVKPAIPLRLTVLVRGAVRTLSPCFLEDAGLDFFAISQVAFLPRGRIMVATVDVQPP